MPRYLIVPKARRPVTDYVEEIEEIPHSQYILSEADKLKYLFRDFTKCIPLFRQNKHIHYNLIRNFWIVTVAENCGVIYGRDPYFSLGVLKPQSQQVILFDERSNKWAGFFLDRVLRS